MGETKGACARSRLTLACIIEGNACEIGVVQVDAVMEQGGSWAFDVEACSLILSSDGESMCIHTCVVDSLDG